MSLYKGSTLLAGIATNTISNAHGLFDFKWTDHELTDQSWLRADTFSWQDGTVYSNAYNHLVDDIRGKTPADVLSETIGSYNIYYYLATDGHKICTPDQETKLQNIYNESGVAWYYILDTANQRFKLPRENPARELLGQSAPVIGNGNTLGLKSANNEYVMGTGGNSNIGTGTYVATIGTTLSGGSGNLGALGITTDATKSGMIADLSETTGVYKGKQYLYFYVGQFSQSATEQTAGLNASLFNGKADRDLNNVSSGIDFVVESYQSGTNWYRLYKSGWVEQGGIVGTSTTSGYPNYTITLLKKMADTNYSVQVTGRYTSETSNGTNYCYSSTKTQISITSVGYGSFWEVKGMSA